MILVFDLDDTLYEEMRFVRGGIAAVARHGQERHGWDAGESQRAMLDLLAAEGRGRVFDRWLASHGARTATRVAECVRVYRGHHPDLTLHPQARRALDRLSHHPRYLVTDGHKLVQAAKVRALGLEPEFRRVFITHRFGIRHAKPSLHCFDLIRRAEGCDWTDMAHIADNPAKDFVNLTPLGVLTVRVLTGAHRDAVAAPGHDARVTIPDLDHLPDVIPEAGRRHP